MFGRLGLRPALPLRRLWPQVCVVLLCLLAPVCECVDADVPRVLAWLRV